MRAAAFSDHMPCLLGLCKKLCVSMIMAAILFSGIVHSADRRRIVSLDEARNLVAAALPQKNKAPAKICY